MTGIGDTTGCVCVIAAVRTTNGESIPDAAFSWSASAPTGVAFQPLFVWPSPSGKVVRPKNTGAPKVVGTPKRRKLIRCSPGTWVSGSAVQFSYSWQTRKGKKWPSIKGARKQAFRIASSSRRGSQFRCQVSAKNTAGVTRAVSSPTRSLKG
jgi:hypothetical protein